MILSPYHWMGAIAIIGAVIALGLYTGFRVRSSGDFLVGSRSMGASLVAGSMLGTVIGGASTIGTAELAFKYGLTAWWWTLGCGLGCFTLGLLASGIRRERVSTVGELLESVYGRRLRSSTDALLIVAMFISFVSNVFAALALLSSASGLGRWMLGLVTLAAIAGYVVLGGLRGTSVVGILKTALVALSLLTAAIAAWSVAGSPLVIARALPDFRCLNLFNRGLWLDLGTALSITLGLVSTQVYTQILASARTDSAARKGAFASALIAPALGLMGVYIGIAMRILDPGADPSQALPLFVLRHLPPVPAGAAIGTFFITAVGTSAGLALAIGTLLSQNLLGLLERTTGTGKTSSRPMIRLIVARLSVFGVIVAAVVIGSVFRPAFILQWTFVSAGLKTASVSPVMILAVVFGKKMKPATGVVAIVGGLAGLVAGRAMRSTVDPVFPALGLSLLCTAIASLVGPARAGTSSRG